MRSSSSDDNGRYGRMRNKRGESAATGTSQSASEDAGSTSGEGKSDANVMIGSAIYKFDDTFMTGVRTAMTDQAKAEGAELELVDSQNKQPTQNEQVDIYYKGCNGTCN